MPRRKLFKRKLKNKTIVEEESHGTRCEDFPLMPYVSESETQKRGKFTGRKEKSSKQVHFAVLPDRYEPLEEDRTSNTATENNQKRKYKRFRKNFGKAFRYTWKCLVVGLQSFSTSYSGPLSAASTLVPEIQRTRPKA
ncbi:hypothetical protein Baya_8941 [Bagarius yarrelli]|uniref:Uncharacterized protein n=1 Tax=Bagarius yarrelli TaxID=175774 RepID=A0A556U7P3_BAGYA|nr:hypothetical protein Baya_8941 [Bagarius yarrelli]